MKLSILVCAALATMCTSTFAGGLKINTMWAASAPDVPSGLQIACVKDGKTLQVSRTCPIIRYQGSTTWVYSFKDNRTSLAVVSYDGDGKVIRNVEHAGARYVAGMTWDPKAQTVTITGEENKTITVPWSELGT
jgi:membrane-bound inhibitor of C-type lysozyme